MDIVESWRDITGEGGGSGWGSGVGGDDGVAGAVGVVPVRAVAASVVSEGAAGGGWDGGAGK
ncbi:hypothetical protein Tco_0761219, partial [Tanacetum coccineum]